MMPEKLDARVLIADLISRGWKPNKIDLACNFTNGYTWQVRTGNVKSMGYAKMARLFNLHEEVMSKRQD